MAVSIVPGVQGGYAPQQQQRQLVAVPAVRPLDLSVLVHNVHLFGENALAGGRETCFYYRDRERVEHIIDHIRRVDADLVCLTEVWDPRLRQRIQEALRDQYPPSHFFPDPDIEERENHQGIAAIREHLLKRWPGPLARLMDRHTPAIVEAITQNHYGGELLGGVEDALAVVLKDRLQIPNLVGHGLLVFSKEGFIPRSGRMIPLGEMAGLDRLSGKKMAHVTFEGPGGVEIDLLATHANEGTSREVQNARKRHTLKAVRHIQEIEARRWAQLGVGVTLFVGDFNVPAQFFKTPDQMTPEYEWLQERFDRCGLVDGCRAFCPQNERAFTFDNDNPFSRRKKNDATEEPCRIDYIWGSRSLRWLDFRVLRDFLHQGEALSDHFPIYAVVQIG